MPLKPPQTVPQTRDKVFLNHHVGNVRREGGGKERKRGSSERESERSNALQISSVYKSDLIEAALETGSTLIDVASVSLFWLTS